jgi:hypothetical protein
MSEAWPRGVYTLYEAAVADDGAVAGYSYSNGIEGFSKDQRKDRGLGVFEVVILDPTGRERLDEKTDRRNSRILHTDPDPKAAGLFLDTENDRAVFRVEDPDVNRSAEAWWTFRLSSGKLISRDGPKTRTPEGFGAIFVLDARPVPGTPLTLVHWWRHEYTRGGSRTGARFTLADLAGGTVWSLDLPDDYTQGGPGGVRRVREDLERAGGILGTGPPGRFALRFYREKQRVTFEVARGEAAGRGWRVKEAAREPFVEPTAGSPTDSAAPERALRPLGTIELAGASPQAPPVRSVQVFDFDGRGRIGFIRREDRALAFVLVNDDGAALRETALDSLRPEQPSVTVAAAWLDGERWLLWTSSLELRAKSSAWWLDAATGALTPIQGFDCPSIQAVGRFDDGGFAVLGLNRNKFTADNEVIAFDSQGKRRWSVRGRDPTAPNLEYYRNGLTVTATGAVCAVSAVRKDVHVFDRDGKFLKSVDLAAAWRRSPNYPSRIVPDVEGGFAVEDFGGTAAVVRMDSEGRIKAQVPPPRTPDGRLVELRGFRVAPDGKLWGADESSIVRLSADGVVEKSLGTPPSEAGAERFVATALDRDDRIHAVDGRTGAVHVFGRTGSALRILKPDLADVSQGLWRHAVTVRDDGTVFVGGDRLGGGGAGTSYVVFSPDGRRSGVMVVDLDSIYALLRAQPGTDRFWCEAYHAIHLLDAAGKPLRAIERRPDGNWLDVVERICVAPNGSVAVASRSSTGTWRGAGSGSALSIYTAAGEPVRSWSFAGVERVHGLAFDGKRIVLTTDSAGFVFDAEGGAISRFSLDGAATRRSGVLCFLTNGGVELWLWSQESRSIRRFEMP